MSTIKQENKFNYYKSGNDEQMVCCAEGCRLKGSHRVILDFNNPKEISYMCLDHIKAHNKSINYYANMSADQIEDEIKADTIWRKPTWPLRGDMDNRLEPGKDYFEFFPDRHEPRKDPEVSSVFPKDIEKAAAILGVSLPTDMADIKKTYKKCVKACHPDLHNGKKNHEERLKKVNIAYKTLTEFLQSNA